jgi:hypothetical protein
MTTVKKDKIIKTKFNSYFVTIVSIKVLKSNIQIDKSNTYEHVGFQMKMGKEVGYNFEEKMCNVELLFEFDAIGNNEKLLDNINVVFTIDFHFKIENMDECISKTDEQINIDPTMPAHLVGMAYSTARGIIYERLANTPLNGLILPVINPYEELKKK